MNAVFVQADRATLTARRERALASVDMTADELRARVESGRALPDEREAWEEVDAVDFLLANLPE
ncbi:MAG: hypothetical protein J2P27_01105 [Actinobacteria bacterium]|nr:hypothetical protein [Actinomycetota bacterium]